MVVLLLLLLACNPCSICLQLHVSGFSRRGKAGRDDTGVLLLLPPHASSVKSWLPSKFINRFTLALDFKRTTHRKTTSEAGLLH